MRKFERDFIFNAIVQEKQNKKFFNFFVKVFKEFDFIPQRICEVGVGGGELARLVMKYLQNHYAGSGEGLVFYFIDNNEEFVREGEKIGGIGICKDFLEVNEEDFVKGRPEVIYSSNTFHWFPFNVKDNRWLKAVEKVYGLLEEGGFFILHQGLKWSYIFLYELGNELFEKLYRVRVDRRKYLFYPSYRELKFLLEDVGFRVISGKEFYETDFAGTANYNIDELIRSFSVAGLNVFLWELEDEEEKKRFRRLFQEYCKMYEPPLLSHRVFIVLRKPIQGYRVEIKKRGSLLSFEVREIKKFLEKVADEFVPSLRVRAPDDRNFSKASNVTGDNVDEYLNGLLREGYSFLLLRGKRGELIGFLSFRVKESEVRKGEKVIYVSTIAIEKKFRGLGLSKVLYEFLFKVRRSLFSEEGVVGVETRTWSTNERIKKVLDDLGFKVIKKIENHRGEGVDTEYYGFYDNGKIIEEVKKL